MSEVPSNETDPAKDDLLQRESAQPRLSFEASSSADAAAAGGSFPAKTKPKRRSRWWWRWTKRLAIAALITRLLLGIFLEQIADFGASFAGLSVSWRSASLSLTTLSLHIEDLAVRDAKDSQAATLLTAHDVVADLSMRELLTGELSITDFSIAGARVAVQRDADGQLRLPAAWQTTTKESAPEPPTEDQPLSFELPCKIHSARIHDLQLDYIDGMVTPTANYTGTLDLDIADLGFADRDGAITLRVYAPQLCDELFVQTNVQAEASSATCQLGASLRGLRPRKFQLADPVRELLEGKHVVDIDLTGEVKAAVLADAPRQANLAGNLDVDLSLDGVKCGAIDLDIGARHAESQTPFSLGVQIDDVVEDLRIEEGRFALSDSASTVTARLQAKNFTGKRLAPLLETMGISVAAAGINFDAAIEAEFGDAIAFDIQDLKLRGNDGEAPATLQQCQVRDLRFTDTALEVGGVKVVGPDLSVRRDADGSMQLAGLRFGPTTPSSKEAAAPPAANDPPAAPPAGITLPTIHVGAIDWQAAQLAYTDASFEPPAELRLQDLKLQSDGLAIGEAAPKGRLVASFGLPDVTDRFAAEWSIEPRPSGLKSELQIQSDGLTLRGLGPWMQTSGIESELTDGSLKLTATIDAEFAKQGLTASVGLRDVELTDGDTRWLSLNSLEGSGISISSAACNLGTWTMQEPLLKLHRDAQQTLHALGLRLGTAQRAAEATPGPAVAAGPTSSPTAWRHGPLEVRDITLALTDTRRPGQLFSIGMDASIGARADASAKLPVRAKVRMDDAVANCTLDGELDLTPTQTSLRAALLANGIRGQGLAPLLPDGTTCTLVDGALKATVAATIDQGDATAIAATVQDIILSDGGDELAAIDEITLKVPTASEDELFIEAANLTGARARMNITDDGVHALGFTFANANQQEQPAPPASQGDPATPPDFIQPTAPQFPRLRVDALAIELDRLQIHDQRDGGGEPIIVQSGLALREPWRDDPKDEQPDAMHFLWTAEVQPSGAKLNASAAVVPFDLTPTIDVDFALTGIDTTKIARISPALGDRLSGEAKALQATAKIHMACYLRRRDPSVFDFSRPFGAEVAIEEFIVKDQATDEQFLSIASIDTIVRAIDAASGSVLIRSLTIDDPVINIKKDAAGTHIAGFLLPTADEGATNPPPDAAAEAVPDQQVRGDSEFAIDRLKLMGLALDYRDTTTDPPTHLSLADTDAELRQFSTRAFTEPRSVSFSAEIRGGLVELEQRIVRSSIIAGVLSSSASALVGAGRHHELEQRAMLDEFTASGQLRLFPKAQGQINLALNELELASFRGLAKSAGIDLADGIYDMRTQVNLLGYDGLTLQSQNVFTHLVLDEPPNGPIRTYLRLPAPLQSILFLLRNNEDQQRIPISLRVPGGGVSEGAITSLAIESLLRLIANATAGVGGRLLHTGSAGMFGGASDVPTVTAEVPFAAGSPLPEQCSLDEMVAALCSDPTLTIVLSHEMGAADQVHAEELANPDLVVVDETIRQLREQRAALEARRPALAAELVARYAAGQRQAATRAQNELGRLDESIGEILSALATAWEQRGNNSKRSRLRRTRQAAIELGQARLDAVSRQLLRACPELKSAPGLVSARIERRPGRGLPVAGQTGGGLVRAVLRRRTAQDLPTERPIRGPGSASAFRTVGFTAVPPVVDPTNRPLNRQ